MGKTKKIEKNIKQLEKEAVDIHNKLKDSLTINLVEDVLQNNELEFVYNDIKYKVTKPTFKQKQEAYQKRIEKYMELLQNPKYMLEEDLKKVYKEKRNIDIDDITKKINALEIPKIKYQEKLGKALKEKAPESELKILREEIEKINADQELLSIRKTNLLEYSIENQTLIFTYSYLSFLIVKKFENKQWIKVWKTYDEFLNSDSKLINRLSFYASLVLRNEIEAEF